MGQKRWMVVILLGVLLIRVLPLLLIQSVRTGGVVSTIEADPLLYLGGARAILATGTNPFNFFPPLNFIFIASFLSLGKGNLFVPTCAMAVVGWLTVVGIYLLAKTLFGEKTALCAALIAGSYPNFIFYGISFYSETLTLFWIVASFLMLVRYFTTSRGYYLMSSGVLWGLTSLTRGGLHYFSFFMVLALAVTHFRKTGNIPGKPIAQFLFATYLTIIVTGLLVSSVQGEFSLNSKSGIGSLIHGANRITTSCPDYGDIRGNIFYAINRCGEQWPEGSQLYSEDLWKLGTGEIFLKVVSFVAHDPLTYLKNSLRKLSCLWSPNQVVIKYVKITLRHTPRSLVEGICGGISLWYVVVICGGLWGMTMAGDPFRRIFIFFILFYCVIVFLSVGNSKLRLPLMPFFIMYCAYFITQVRTIPWKRILLNKWCVGITVIFICNSVYTYQEICLSPAEVEVRQTELCTTLGFPKTALYLIGQYRNYGYYTRDQKERLMRAEENAHAQLQAAED